MKLLRRTHQNILYILLATVILKCVFVWYHYGITYNLLTRKEIEGTDQNASKGEETSHQFGDSGNLSSFVCGKNYMAEFVTRRRGPCMNPLPKLMLLGKRQKVGNGGFDIGPSCPIKWFSAAEACHLFGQLGHVAFLGDSLIRQLVVGVGAVLSGNFRTGGINAISNDYLLHCQCEHQWQCYKDPVQTRFQSTVSAPQFTICPLWTRDHVSWQKGLSSLNQTRPKNDSLVIIHDGSALHTALEWSIVKKEMEAALDIARHLGGDLIPMTVHWPGPNKPAEFRKSQGVEKVELYHSKLREWSTGHDVWVLESYQFTKGEWSRDGVHYDDRNIALAQLLMNYLERMLEAGKLRPVFEFNPIDPSTYHRGKPENKNIPVYRGPH